MADAPVVVTGTSAGAPTIGKLLEGHNFFLVQRLPARSHLIQDIESNGGRVVKLETKADYIIADHARKDAPAGSLSYTFVEQAIRHATLPDPADHLAGPRLGTVRDVGSAVPGKATRTPFTAEDDKVLWRWVEEAKASGGSSKGNEVYKLLGANNPRHTWQSWRDRYIKKLIDKPPAGVMIAANAPPSPPSAPDNEPSPSLKSPRKTPSQPPPKRRKPNLTPQRVAAAFDQSDFDALMDEAAAIETIHDRERDKAWKAWSRQEEYQHHTAREWREFYQTEVRPVYVRLNIGLGESEDAESESEADPSEIGERPNNTSEVHEPAGHRADDAGGSERPSQGHIDQAPGEYCSSPESRTSKHGTKRKRTGAHSQNGSNASDAASERPTSPTIDTTSESAAARLQSQSRIAETVDADMRNLFESVPALRVLQASVQAQASQPSDFIPPSSSQLITSDVNREAALQLQADAERAAAKVQDDLSESDETSVGDDDELSSLIEAVHGEEDVAERPRHALTAANLASQEAERKGRLMRGADLPEDDPNMDQSDFITFLQEHLPGPTTMKVLERSGEEESVLEGEEKEVDAVESANQESRRTPTERGQFQETRDFLPRLSSHAQIEGHHAPVAHMGSGRPSMEAVLRDSQDNEAEQPVDNSSALLNEYTHADAEGPAGDMFSDEEEGDHTLREAYYAADDEIDLNIPEPDGGFTFTSSVNGEANEGQSQLPAGNGSDDGYLNPDATSLSSAAVSSAYRSSAASQSLQQGPETPRTRAHHQAEAHDVVDFGSQELDLDIPSPGSMLHDEEEHLGEPVADTRPRLTRVLETQDIIDAETQYPDLDVALPFSDEEDDKDSDEDSSNASEIPAFPKRTPRSRPSITVESQALSSTGDDLDEWLATQIVRGYSEDSCMRSILCTSMRPDLAELVMLSEKAGTGIPQDVPGIWTEYEDRIVESGDAGAIRRLEAKHGWKECEARMKFLAEWREV